MGKIAIGSIPPFNLSSFLDRAAVTINELVREDSLKSVWQNNKKGGRYKSEQYKKYKSRNMKKLNGKRLKGYEGISIISNQTNRVNMTLTGRMANSLKIKKKGTDFIEMGYGDDYAGAVIGNQELGRDVVGLNNKNQKKIVKMYERALIKYFGGI